MFLSMIRFQNFFNKKNIFKMFIIFTFGFLTRILVNYHFNVNVFTDYNLYISIWYYSALSVFIVFIHYISDFLNLDNLSFKLFSNLMDDNTLSAKRIMYRWLKHIKYLFNHFSTHNTLYMGDGLPNKDVHFLVKGRGIYHMVEKKSENNNSDYISKNKPRSVQQTYAYKYDEKFAGGSRIITPEERLVNINFVRKIDILILGGVFNDPLYKTSKPVNIPTGNQNSGSEGGNKW